MFISSQYHFGAIHEEYLSGSIIRSLVQFVLHTKHYLFLEVGDNRKRWAHLGTMRNERVTFYLKNPTKTVYDTQVYKIT
jgi:hypothetical protein